MAVSQPPLISPGKPMKSLADLVERIADDSRLPAAKRRAYCGAVRTLGAVLGRDVAALPASMVEIEKLLREVPHPSHGRSRKTIANTRSQLKAALLHFTDGPLLPPHGTPLSTKWKDLYSRLTDLRLRNGLSRFIRIASYRGVEPHDVDDAFVQEVLAAISKINWGRDTLPFWRTTVTIWNEAAGSIASWPTQRLSPPPEMRKPRHLTFDQLPDSFRNDLDAYSQWASGADRFADDGPTTPLKPSTLRQRRESLRLAASTLAFQLGDVSKVDSLATLVVPTHTKTILSKYISEATDSRPTAFIRSLSITLLAVARHWVKVPMAQMEELKRLNAKLGSTPTGLTPKNQDLIRRFQDPAHLTALLDLPEKLRKQANSGRSSPARRLQKMQIAVAIEILLAAPMRMQNLCTLELGRTLQWPSGYGGPAYVVLRRDETKNDQPLEYPLPDHCLTLLREYLDRFRSYAERKEREWLFVRLDGSRVPDSAMRDGITKAIARELGIEMTPHQFRHVAASVALDVHPGALGLVRDLLGHKNIKTTAGFYAGLRTRESAKEYDRIIERSRSSKVVG